MFSWLNSQSINNLMGLDMGSNALKLLKINSESVPYTIEQFLIQPLPKKELTKGPLKNPLGMSDALKKMLNQAKIITNNVAISIPVSSTIIKNINIDRRLTPEEIEDRVWIEANHHFPELVGDIYLDYSILGASQVDHSQIEVMLVACRKDQIKPYLESLDIAGLKPKIVDVNSYALERALNIILKDKNDWKTVALLNLDYTLSTIIVVQDNKLIYAHDQTFNGQRLLNETQAFFSEKNAIEETKYKEILKENMSAHLRHAMHFFYSSRPQVTIEKVLMSGDCATIPELQSYVQEEIGIDTVIANPFDKMQMSDNINLDIFNKVAPTLMLCCGLALSKMRLP